MNDFNDDLNRVLRYSMDTVENMLGQLASPEFLHTRAGTAKGDHTFRGALADALQERDREAEADLLRSGHHVVVHEGRVVPGRFTLRHLIDFRNRMGELTGVDHEFLPEVGWETDDPGDDGVDEQHVFDLGRHLTDDDIPVVSGSTFTCHDYECPIHEAPKEMAELATDTLFDRRNHVEGLPHHSHWPALEKQIKSEAAKVPVEEPVPQ